MGCRAHQEVGRAWAVEVDVRPGKTRPARSPSPYRVVLAQLGPGGEGGDLPPTPQFEFLSGYLSTHPLAGGQHPDEWLEGLMAQPEHGQLLGETRARGAGQRRVHGWRARGSAGRSAAARRGPAL